MLHGSIATISEHLSCAPPQHRLKYVTDRLVVALRGFLIGGCYTCLPCCFGPTAQEFPANVFSGHTNDISETASS